MPVGESLRWLRERKRMGSHLIVDASIFQSMTKRRPALEETHGSDRCTEEETDTGFQMLST